MNIIQINQHPDIIQCLLLGSEIFSIDIITNATAITTSGNFQYLTKAATTSSLGSTDAGVNNPIMIQIPIMVPNQTVIPMRWNKAVMAIAKTATIRRFFIV